MKESWEYINVPSVISGKNSRASVEDALIYAHRILRTRQYTEYEICQKLQRRYTDNPSLIKSALAILKKEHLIDDANYCELYVEYAVSNGYSYRRLVETLLTKGINKTVPYFPMFNSELEKAAIQRQLQRLTLKKPLLPADSENYKSIVSRLIALGFDYELIKEVLKIKGENYED